MTPLFKKLNYKEQNQILAINSPESFRDELDQMKDEASIVYNFTDADKIEFAIGFAIEEHEVEDFISHVNEKSSGDVTVWISYPKSSSKKYTCNFNRDTGFSAAGKAGFEPVRQVSIDSDWSALRFRRVEFIKKITRRESYALTQEAKKRTTNKGVGGST